jgi:hypothetical protein
MKALLGFINISGALGTLTGILIIVLAVGAFIRWLTRQK